ncbi:hypothetical protein BDW68DRAFT_154786 [Aspergillus falconensis]
MHHSRTLQYSMSLRSTIFSEHHQCSNRSHFPLSAKVFTPGMLLHRSSLGLQVVLLSARVQHPASVLSMGQSPTWSHS